MVVSPLRKKSAVRAAHALGLDDKAAKKLTGSPQAATDLMSVYRDLQALMGGDEAAMRQSLEKPNRELGAVPGELLTEEAGIRRVAD